MLCMDLPVRIEVAIASGISVEFINCGFNAMGKLMPVIVTACIPARMYAVNTMNA